ncbi:hypothetical protein SNE40_009756 [Patella caerulea]|uniref:Uncharacterized protein n=1 Tax=Patella caerulea TaxID=87958 RepID=A0AAN8JQ72_PATCE
MVGTGSRVFERDGTGPRECGLVEEGPGVHGQVGTSVVKISNAEIGLMELDEATEDTILEYDDEIDAHAGLIQVDHDEIVDANKSKRSKSGMADPNKWQRHENKKKLRMNGKAYNGVGKIDGKKKILFGKRWKNFRR